MSSERKTNMYSILCDIEDNTIEIERVKNLLQVYLEQMGRELKILEHAEPWLRNQITGRYEILSSLLDAAQHQLYETLCAMNKTLEVAFAVMKNDEP